MENPSQHIKHCSTDESGSEAPSGKPAKSSRQVALPDARGKGKGRSTNRPVVDSDSDSNLDDNEGGKSISPEGKSPLHVSSKYLTNTVAVVPPPKAVGKSSKQQKSLPPAQSKPAARPVPVKRKKVVDTDHGSQDGDSPTKKAKPS
jgi:hypothetical protein